MAQVIKLNGSGTTGSGTYTTSASELPASTEFVFTGTLNTSPSAPWDTLPDPANIFVLGANWSHQLAVSGLSPTIDCGIDGRFLYVFRPQSENNGDVQMRLESANNDTASMSIWRNATDLLFGVRWNSDGSNAEANLGAVGTVPTCVEMIIDLGNATAAERVRWRRWALGDSVPETFNNASATFGAAATGGNSSFDAISVIQFAEPNNGSPDLAFGLFVYDDDPTADLSALLSSAAAAPTISSVTPSTVTPSSNPVITGTNFEATQGTGVVTISPTDDVDDVDAETQTITAWGDTEITLDGVTFPTGTAHNDTLYLFVTNDSAETNASGEALTASVAPALSNGGVVDTTTDGFKLTWDTDTDSGTSAWALFATAEHRNAWTVSGLPGELTEPANSVDWGTQAVTALGTQETALITGLGEGQTLYYRIYHYGDVTANGS